jgi:hypothetical protein
MFRVSYEKHGGNKACKHWDAFCKEISALLFKPDTIMPIMHIKSYEGNKDDINMLIGSLDYQLQIPPIIAERVYSILYQIACFIWDIEGI